MKRKVFDPKYIGRRVTLIPFFLRNKTVKTGTIIGVGYRGYRLQFGDYNFWMLPQFIILLRRPRKKE